MDRTKASFFFLLMLLGHVAHVFEEVWARFWPLEKVFGLGWFLAINWLLLCFPVAVFYFILGRKRWAYYLGIAYAAVMILNGVVHNVATLVTGRYFGGFAGGFSGIGLILVGLPLIHYLRRAMAAAGDYRSPATSQVS